jgi:proline iminopeptidase
MLELAKDHQLIFYDQRGSGQSLDTEISPEFMNVNQFVQDLEDLRKDLGLDKFVLLGHSWGGELAMHYAVTYPEAVSALILMSTGPANEADFASFVESFMALIAPIQEKIKPLLDYAEFEKLTETEILQLFQDLFAVYLFDPLKIQELSLSRPEHSAKSGERVRHIIRGQPKEDLFPKLRELHVPSLLIHGEEDVVPLWTAEKISQTIPGAKLVRLKNCVHFPYIEKPEETFAAIREFLNIF